MLRLKECRLKANLPQQYVALTLGIKPPSVSNWESGKTQPTMDNLIKLAQLYNVTTDYLLGIPDFAVMEDCQADSEEEKTLLRGFRALTDDDKKEVLEYIEFKGRKKEQERTMKL